MMAIPFFGFFLALAATLAGARNSAILLWALSIVVTLVLFKLHATSPLNLNL